jgi:hypothetical protein
VSPVIRPGKKGIPLFNHSGRAVTRPEYEYGRHQQGKPLASMNKPTVGNRPVLNNILLDNIHHFRQYYRLKKINQIRYREKCQEENDLSSISQRTFPGFLGQIY